MNFLAKLEDFINALLIKLTELSLRTISRFLPSSFKVFSAKCISLFHMLLVWIKGIPFWLKTEGIAKLQVLKSKLFSFDFKGIFQETFNSATAQYQQHSKGATKFKALFLTPFLLMGKWLQGLSAGQALLLLAFTAGSFLAGINIIFSGQRIAGQYNTGARAPASVDEALKYDRPEYYKKELKHITLTNLRLPIYFPEVNELKSVDIDFTATISNRQSRKYLERQEFQLRDHLILHVEPLVATFPLTEEGKDVLKEKIWLEINAFLKTHEQEGEVIDLKITYVLAN
jgi:flagellar basal body-associated protein FliL